MSTNMYELLALGMRYVFAAIMVLIVIRAARITAVDSRRARKLRRLSPQTGIIGEMLVVDGDGRVKSGSRFPLTLEGAIGSSGRADIRLRHASVKSRHAFYQMTDDGLFVRRHAAARIYDDLGTSVREITLTDGDCVIIGRIKLMLVLSNADETPGEMARPTMRRRDVARRGLRDVRDDRGNDDIFSTSGGDPDDMFLSNPAGRFSAGADHNVDDDKEDDPYDTGY